MHILIGLERWRMMPQLNHGLWFRFCWSLRQTQSGKASQWQFCCHYWPSLHHLGLTVCSKKGSYSCLTPFWKWPHLLVTGGWDLGVHSLSTESPLIKITACIRYSFPESPYVCMFTLSQISRLTRVQTYCFPWTNSVLIHTDIYQITVIQILSCMNKSN